MPNTTDFEVTIPCAHALPPDGGPCARPTRMWVRMTSDWDGETWSAGVKDDAHGCGCELTCAEERTMKRWAIEDVQDNPPQE